MAKKSPALSIDKIAEDSTILIPTFSLGDVTGGSAKQLRQPRRVETTDQSGDVDFHPAGSRHTVQFYENEEFLSRIVRDSVSTAIRTKNPSTIIATAEHWQAVQAGLTLNQIDVPALMASGQLSFLDAEQTVTALMVDGLPDRERFRTSVRDGLANMLNDWPDRTLYAFDEMVDILVRRDNSKAAIQLEGFWNELLKEFSVNLLCGYSMRRFENEAHYPQVVRICEEHDHTHPTEQHDTSQSTDDTLREIALLQQRAKSLETEIEHRKQLEQKLREANRLKDEFMTLISHELRTPLTAIMGWTQLAIDRSDEAMMRRALDVVKRNATLQLHLVDEILDISRIVTGKLVINPSRVDLHALLTAAVDSVRPAAEAKNIALSPRFDSGVSFVIADPARLQQVVWNLLSNAVKFTENNGSVELVLDKDDSDIHIIVRDSGRGIAAEFLADVFDPFRQAENVVTRKSGGLGVGLTVVRHLVEAHGGTVSVQSPGINLGSTFTVSLPAKID